MTPYQYQKLSFVIYITLILRMVCLAGAWTRVFGAWTIAIVIGFPSSSLRTQWRWLSVSIVPERAKGLAEVTSWEKGRHGWHWGHLPYTGHGPYSREVRVDSPSPWRGTGANTGQEDCMFSWSPQGSRLDADDGSCRRRRSSEARGKQASVASQSQQDSRSDVREVRTSKPRVEEKLRPT